MYVCWRCSQSARPWLIQPLPASGTWRLFALKHASHSRSFRTGAGQQAHHDDGRHSVQTPFRNIARSYATQAQAASPQDDTPLPTTFTITRGSGSGMSVPDYDPDSATRHRLRQWQKDYGHDKSAALRDIVGGPSSGNVYGFPPPAASQDQLSDESEGLDHWSLAPGAGELETALESLDPDHRLLRPGDLVEMPYVESSKDPMIAVFVRYMNPQIAQFLGAAGKWLHMAPTAPQFVVPGYIASEDVELMYPYLPTTVSVDTLSNAGHIYDLDIPRHVSGPVVSRLTDFVAKAQDLYRRHASRLDGAHDLLAHREDLKFGTITQIARALLQKPSPTSEVSIVELFATRLALQRAGFAFSFDSLTHRLTGLVNIRSKSRCQTVDRVTQWLRDYRDHFDGRTMHVSPAEWKERQRGINNVNKFVEKAKMIITESRKDRQPTVQGFIGPSKVRRSLGEEGGAVQDVYSTSFSKEDEDIIRFMENWCIDRGYRRLGVLSSQPPIILHAVGMYKGFPLAPSTGFLFLQEIGVLTPYENRSRYSETLLLPASQHSKPLEKLASKLAQTSQSEQRFVDSMQHLRHDWGKLPVFCVDGEGAREIDDGVSLEPLEDGTSWLHIHVANPTAYIDNESPPARMARHMGETVYQPERAYTMLPQWLTQKHFSLAPRRPCITFSARLNDDGELLDIAIKPGRISNVVYVNPKTVNKYVGSDAQSSDEVYLCVGGTAPKMPFSRQTSDLSVENQESLRRIFQLAAKRSRLRTTSSGITLPNDRSDVRVWSKSDIPGLGWGSPSRQRARRVEGDPVIELFSKRYSGVMKFVDLALYDASSMVQECMLLASEISARWAHHYGVPIIFRGSLPFKHGYALGEAQRFYKTHLEPALQEHNGSIPMTLLSRYLHITPAGTMSLEPIYHEQLGLKYYSKVTSPLRRYGDMVTHWQLEAAMREDAARGQKPEVIPVAPEPTGITTTTAATSRTPPSPHGREYKTLPYSAATLSQMLTSLSTREQRVRIAKFTGLDFWTCMLLFRAHYFGEAQLPSPLTVYVTSVGEGMGTLNGTFDVRVRELGIRAKMYQRDGAPEVLSGDVWEVAWSRIDPYQALCNVQALQLLERAV